MGDLLQALRGTVGDQLGSYGIPNYYIGTVTSLSPLEIQVDDRTFLYAADLTLTEAVLQKQLDLTHLHEVVGSTGSAAGPESHSHTVDIDSQKALTGRITIQEGLQVGDKVLMLALDRNQMFVVLSKIRDKTQVVIDAANNWRWS